MTRSEERELEGKRIVVTGAAAGLGRAYALALTEAGASVVLNDVDSDGLATVVGEIESRGGSALALPGSVADPDHAAQLVSTCVERYGGLDGLVSNAAVHHFSPFAEERIERLRRVVEVNVLGSLVMAFEAFTVMASHGAGRILNVTSGAHLGLSTMVAYGTTKGAVSSLTYGLALEAADVGVQVNALAPVAQTAMSPKAQRSDGVVRPEPGQIAPMVVYLMSDAAGDLNGHVLRYDGSSVSMLEPPRFSADKVSNDVSDAPGIARAMTRLRQR